MLDQTDIRPQLRLLLADRHSPEARALFLTLAGYAHSRVRRHARSRYGDLLGAPDEEELVADVLLQLMAGSLATFRGHSLPELLAFVRSICDRSVWRLARLRRRERDTLEGPVGEEVRGWNAASPSPEASVRMVPASPLNQADQGYLMELLEAGSKAEMARLQGVSRAAVTQRVQRIRARIEQLSPRDQATAEAWLRGSAERRAHHVG